MSLPERLVTLEAAGLIRASVVEALDATYRFSHALVQDAAYASLLKVDRRHLHRLAAQALEALYPERRDEFAAELARHYDEAGEAGRALPYYLAAGEAAAQRFANAEAVAAYTRALALAEQSATPLDTPTLLHVYGRLGRAQELINRFSAALACYQQLETLGAARNAPTLTLAGLNGQVTLHATMSPLFDAPRALALGLRALTLAESLGDVAAEARACWNLMLASNSVAKPDEALVYGERSLALARQHGLREQLAFTTHDIAWLYEFRDTAHAYALRQEAAGLWRALGNLPMLADCLINLVLPTFIMGDSARALELASEARALNHMLSNRWGQVYGGWIFAQVYSETGDFQAALDGLFASLELAVQAKLHTAEIMACIGLALVYFELGLSARALEYTRRSVALARDHTLPGYVDSSPQLGQAQLLAETGAYAEAEQQLAELGRSDADAVHELRTALTLAVIAAGRGERARARALLSAWRGADGLMQHLVYGAPILHAMLWLARWACEAQAWAEAEAALARGFVLAERIHSARVLWRLWAVVAEVAAGQGDAVRAEEARGHAVRGLEEIGARLSDPMLRAAWYAQADARAVLGTEVRA